MDIDIPREEPKKITDLCDDVLIKIFTYLDLYDKNIVLPEVCKRFEEIVCGLPTIKEISSRTFATKWNETSTSQLFRKVGHGIKKVKIDYVYTTHMKSRKSHLNMMLREIRRNCSNVSTLHIAPIASVRHTKTLPKTIRTFSVEMFRGKSLNLKYLSNLEILHLGLEDIPNGFDWLKVKNRLKEMKLMLNCNTIPNNLSTIDQFLSSMCDKSSINIGMFSVYKQRINLEDFCNVANLKELAVSEISTDGESINRMLRFLAEKNSVTKISIGTISGPASTIHLKTITSLLRWTALERLFFYNNDLIDSLITGFIDHFKLKNIRMYCGPLPVPPNAYYMDISTIKLKEVVNFFQTFEMFQLYPKNGKIIFQSQIIDDDIWAILKARFLQGFPRVVASTSNLSAIIEAYV